MPLRGTNNPNTDIAIMGVLQNILPISTQLAATSTSGTGTELIFIQNKYLMSQAITAEIPVAVNLLSGHQTYKRLSQRTYDGMVDITVDYYSRWNDQNTLIDTVWANIASDLERMKSNVESNDSLAYGGQNYAIGIPTITLSPYEGEIDRTFVGLTLIHRWMLLGVNILPYDV